MIDLISFDYIFTFPSPLSPLPLNTPGTCAGLTLLSPSDVTLAQTFFSWVSVARDERSMKTPFVFDNLLIFGDSVGYYGPQVMSHNGFRSTSWVLHWH